MKRGVLLSLDAIFAITILITVSLFLSGIAFTHSSPELRYSRYYHAGKDLSNVLEDAKLAYVSGALNLSEYGLDSGDYNRTLLDVIGSFWAEGNASKAGNFTGEVFSGIFNRTGLDYEVVLNGESIYSTGGEPSDFLARLSTVVSGYEKTRPVNGYLAKVYLTKAGKISSKFVYFGGYVGDGNLTKNVSLPVDANVTSVYMELNAGNDFDLYVNGNHSGSYGRSQGNFSASKWTVCSSSFNPSCCSFFEGGQNLVEIRFTGGGLDYVGGGYLRVSYKTSELTEGEYLHEGGTAEGRYTFPGINGIINLYSSFYVPGTLNNMSVYLHYKNNLSLNNQGIPLYFTMGGREIYRSNQTGEMAVEIPEENVSGEFGGKAELVEEVSNSTMPIRVGTETFAFLEGEGASDSVLITDISGSMSTCDVSSDNGPCDCNSPPPCERDRIKVAREVDKEFVNTLLNYTGSRVGLASYSTETEETHDLSNDSLSLNSQIDGYGPQDYTCISCGISDAVNMIGNSKMVERLVPSGSLWLYNTSFPSSDPPEINGTGWNGQNYTDSGWPEGQAILGFEDLPYSPSVDTDISDNGGDYYFRKHFQVEDPEGIDFLELYLLADDDAEIYINGNLVDNYTGDGHAKYWNRGDVLFEDDFEDYYGTGSHQIDGTDINRSPGYWYVDDGGEEVYMMCGQGDYPSHSGADVLVFRDMDSYGYAETRLDLSGMDNLELSYWWRMGENPIETDEYADIRLWDGEWHTHKTYSTSDNYNEYWRETIDLSEYEMVENFAIRIGAESSFDDERFYVDRLRVREVLRLNTSCLLEGDNVVAVKLLNDDADSAKFDLELNATMERYESILVMSDGYANRCVPGHYCPWGVDASDQSVELACRARDEYGIDVYVVAFGSGADLENLERIACWNCSAGDWIPDCGNFYNSSSSEELKSIYQNIADQIANATYKAQVFNFSGNVSLENVLYADSSIRFNYTPVFKDLEYGEITLSFESPRFNESTGDETNTDNETGTKEGWFTIPSDGEVSTRVLDSKITSYSSYYWSDRLWVNSSNTPNRNWTRVFWLGNFTDDYENIGDPFVIQIPPRLLKAGGNNSFKIGTGMYPSLSGGRGGSPDDRVIYSLGIRGVTLNDYSDILPKAMGSTPTIYYDTDGDNVPEKSITVEVGPEPDDIFDPWNDSIDNGFMKLMDSMNFINDLNPGVADLNGTDSGPSGTADASSSNPVDLEVTEDIEFKADFITQIPSMWGPALMEVKIWA